ncbi:hypothetical protein, partial [Xanthomonas vesicatoria]
KGWRVSFYLTCGYTNLNTVAASRCLASLQVLRYPAARPLPARQELAAAGRLRHRMSPTANCVARFMHTERTVGWAIQSDLIAFQRTGLHMVLCRCVTGYFWMP